MLRVMGNNVGLTLGKDVLLFFEDRDRDTFVRGDRRLRRFLRKKTMFLRPGKQKISGFELSFILLCRALKLAGQNVHVNDFSLARMNPTFPVGICGYTHILDHWRLPNPAVLGPGLFDHPKQAPKLLEDARFQTYIAFCDWMRDEFARVYPIEKMRLWFGGIDLKDWLDTSPLPKTTDVLVYDKIRWNRERYVPELLEPLLNDLRLRGRSVDVVRYGAYTHEMYRDLLARSKTMVFLCEHETQGMAYQEALASNIPVLAWDQGFWLDPNRSMWGADAVPASSVPYFSDVCGERFKGADDFGDQFDRLWSHRDAYRPREWVAANLSLARSAELYLEAYMHAAQGSHRVAV